LASLAIESTRFYQADNETEMPGVHLAACISSDPSFFRFFLTRFAPARVPVY
jgi:hypothetical protein